MFNRFINKEVEIIFKNGTELFAYVLGMYCGFVIIEEKNSSCSMISLDIISSISTLHNDVSELESKPLTDTKERINPVRVSAKISSRPNEFSMDISPEQPNSYKSPTFVRETYRSEK